MTTAPLTTDSAPFDERVSGFVTERLGGAEVVPLSGDASTRRYFRLTREGRTFVLALYPEPFAASDLSFCQVGRLLAGWGLPVPETCDVDGARGILLLEDLGDTTLQDLVRDGRGPDVAGWYRTAAGQIVHLQRAAAGHRGAEPCFEIAFDAEKLSWELGYFLKYFLEGQRRCVLSAGEREDLTALFSALAEEIASWPRVLCHRDYHSRNLMWFGGTFHWVDYQDARMGPVTYDLASLLRDSYVDLGEDLVDAEVEAFRRTAAPDEPRESFRRRFDLTCVQRNLKALGTFGFMDVIRGKDVYLGYIPRTLAHVRRNLERHAELAPLHRALARHLEELR